MASQYLCSEAVLLHVEKAQELEPDVVLMDISRLAIPPLMLLKSDLPAE